MNQRAWMPIRVLIPVVCAAVPLIATAQPCSPSDTTLCLSSNRFSVTATWRKSDGTSGQGHAITVTGDTGYFWFFDPSNIEVVTKLLNACGVNNRYWVFGSGLTNTGVTLTLTDTATSETRTYVNPVGVAFEAIQDTAAFDTCAVPTPQIRDFSGSWVADIGVSGIGHLASMTVRQSGSSVSGTASVVNGGGGYLTGSINGNVLTFSVAEVSPCPGNYSGTASLSPSGYTINGTIGGADCLGGYSGSIEAIKTFVAGGTSGQTQIAGSWNFNLFVGGRSYSGVLTYVQNGSALSGTASITGFGSGSLTGSIVGSTLTLTINELSPCLGVFLVASTNATANTMSGNIVGTDCDGGWQGTVSANR